MDGGRVIDTMMVLQFAQPARTRQPLAMDRYPKCKTNKLVPVSDKTMIDWTRDNANDDLFSNISIFQMLNKGYTSDGG